MTAAAAATCAPTQMIDGGEDDRRPLPVVIFSLHERDSSIRLILRPWRHCVGVAWATSLYRDFLIEAGGTKAIGIFSARSDGRQVVAPAILLAVLRAAAEDHPASPAGLLPNLIKQKARDHGHRRPA